METSLELDEKMPEEYLGHCPHCHGVVERSGYDFIVCWHKQWCPEVFIYVKKEMEKEEKKNG